jgi:hypothetical protein
LYSSSIAAENNFAQGETPQISQCNNAQHVSAPSNIFTNPLNAGQQAEASLESQGHQENRFKYPQFEGPDGRGLLSNICKQILPKACFEMWASSVSYQQPGNDCYVGSARQQRDLAIRMNLSPRTIRWRWQQFEMRGLVRFEEKIVEIQTEDGQTRCEVRHIKNFEALYDLADEFYRWWKSPYYIAPLKENAEAIHSNPELAMWLLQFDCYQTILLHKPRGRKPTPKPSYQELVQHHYQQLQSQENQAPAPPAMMMQNGYEKKNVPEDTKRQIFSKTFSKKVAVDTNLHSNSLLEEKEKITKLPEKKEEQVPATIRNVDACIPPHENTTLNPEPRQQPEPSTTHDAKRSEDEQRSEQKTAMSAAAGGEQNEYKEQIATIVDHARGETPRQVIEHIMHDLRPILNDASYEASTVTSVYNTFVRACEFDEEVIRATLKRAAQTVMDEPDASIKKRHPENHRANRVPKFIAMLAACKKGVYAERRKAAKAAKEAQKEAQTQRQETVNDQQLNPGNCAMKRDQTPGQQGAHAQQPTPQALTAEEQEARELLQAADYYGFSLSHEQRNALAHGDEEVLASIREELEAIEFEVLVQQQTKAILNAARDEIQKHMREHILVRIQHPCPDCGNTLAARVGTEFYCLHCDMLSHWTPEQTDLINTIIDAIPTPKQIERAVYQNYYQGESSAEERER